MLNIKTKVELGKAFLDSFLGNYIMTCSFPMMCLYMDRRGPAGMLSGHIEGEATLIRIVNARCQMNEHALQRILLAGCHGQQITSEGILLSRFGVFH
jgi:hypothetical protein